MTVSSASGQNRITADANDHSLASPRTTYVSKSVAHLMAGGAGGLATAILLSPLDVFRTRLQSTLARTSHGAGPKAVQSLHNLTATIVSIHRQQGLRGFFTGLLPSIAGVVPATATKLYVYGISKPFFAAVISTDESSSPANAMAALSAGLATATVTNPIWLVKTRLQLDGGKLGAVACAKEIFRQEGFRAFWRGVSASYVGSIETVMHLVLYEKLKKALIRDDHPDTWWAASSAAGLAKAAAVGFAYPHEVIRTRMRQAPSQGGGLSFVKTCRPVWMVEGMVGLYGGLLPHVLRSIPSAMISLGVYEATIRRIGA